MVSSKYGCGKMAWKNGCEMLDPNPCSLQPRPCEQLFSSQAGFLCTSALFLLNTNLLQS